MINIIEQFIYAMTYLVFSTWTTDLSCVGWILGRDLRTWVRMLSSVDVAGREDKNSDVWKESFNRKKELEI